MAIDGRWGLRWPRDGRGEYVYRLITELRFLSRSYDIKIFGDQSAHPDVVKKVRILHPVEILMTPSDFLWEQSAFPQAVRGAQLIHATAGAAPVATRISRVVTIYEEMLAHPLYIRRLRRAQALFALIDGTEHLARRIGVPPSHITPIPVAPTLDMTEPIFPKDPFLLMEDGDPAGLAFALGLLPDLNDPPMTLRVVVHSPREEETAHRFVRRSGMPERVNLVVAQSSHDLAEHYRHTSAVLIGSINETTVLSGLNAAAAGAPVVVREHHSRWPLPLADSFFTIDDALMVHDARQTIHTLLTNPELQRTKVEQAQDHVRHLTWKEAARLTDQIYQDVLGR